MHEEQIQASGGGAGWTVSESPPSAGVEGAQWYDAFNGKLKRHNGTDWEAVDGEITPPSAPTNLALVAGHGQFTVRWGVPLTDGGAAVTDYDVQYKLESAEDWTDHAFVGTGTSDTVTGLVSGGIYDVRVRASNSEGAGPWTEVDRIALVYHSDTLRFSLSTKASS